MGEREWNFGNSLSPKGIFDPFLVISNTSAPLQQSGLTWSSVQDPAPHSYLSCSCELWSWGGFPHFSSFLPPISSSKQFCICSPNGPLHCTGNVVKSPSLKWKKKKKSDLPRFWFCTVVPWGDPFPFTLYIVFSPGTKIQRCFAHWLHGPKCQPVVLSAIWRQKQSGQGNWPLQFPPYCQTLCSLGPTPHTCSLVLNVPP